MPSGHTERITHLGKPLTPGMQATLARLVRTPARWLDMTTPEKNRVRALCARGLVHYNLQGFAHPTPDGTRLLLPPGTWQVVRRDVSYARFEGFTCVNYTPDAAGVNGWPPGVHVLTLAPQVDTGKCCGLRHVTAATALCHADELNRRARR